MSAVSANEVAASEAKIKTELGGCRAPAQGRVLDSATRGGARCEEITRDWRVVLALFPVLRFVAPFLITAAPRFGRRAPAAEPWTALRPCEQGGTARRFKRWLNTSAFRSPWPGQERRQWDKSKRTHRAAWGGWNEHTNAVI